MPFFESLLARAGRRVFWFEHAGPLVLTLHSGPTAPADRTEAPPAGPYNLLAVYFASAEAAHAAMEELCEQYPARAALPAPAPEPYDPGKDIAHWLQAAADARSRALALPVGTAERNIQGSCLRSCARQALNVGMRYGIEVTLPWAT